MEELLTKEGLAYIVSRILDNAKDTFKESKTDKSEFVDGKKLAYYEMLDTIKNELIVRDADLETFGLDINLEKYV